MKMPLNFLYLLLLLHLTFFIELASSSTKPFSSSHSFYSGISLFYKSSFSPSNIHYPYSTFECLHQSIFLLIYRPPTSSLSLFFEKFSVSTETLYMHPSPFFLFWEFFIFLIIIN